MRVAGADHDGFIVPRLRPCSDLVIAQYNVPEKEGPLLAAGAERMTDYLLLSVRAIINHVAVNGNLNFPVSYRFTPV